MSTETPSLPQNCSDSCLARNERNLHYRNWRNVRACIERKMCYPSVVMATGLGQPLPKYCGLFESQVCVKIKLANILPHHILQQLNLSVEIGNFTIHFSSKTLPASPQGASRVHANQSYLFKVDILKGKILLTDKLLAVSFIVHQLLPSFFFLSICQKLHPQRKFKNVLGKISPQPAPCPLLPVLMI